MVITYYVIQKDMSANVGYLCKRKAFANVAFDWSNKLLTWFDFFLPSIRRRRSSFVGDCRILLHLDLLPSENLAHDGRYDGYGYDGYDCFLKIGVSAKGEYRDSNPREHFFSS